MDTILDSTKAAELLSAHKHTITKLCRTGEIKAYKKLRKWYILHSDLIKYIKS